MHGYSGTSRDSPRLSQVLGGHTGLGQSQVLGRHTDLGFGCMGTVRQVGTVPCHPRYLEEIQTWDLGAWVQWDKMKGPRQVLGNPRQEWLVASCAGVRLLVDSGTGLRERVLVV